MKLLRTHRATTALGAFAAAASLVALAATPASASIVDTDRPKITETSFDFGLKWDGFGAPLNGGNLYWDKTTGPSGTITPNLQGYLYLKNASGDCGRIHIEYFNATEVKLGEDTSDWHCMAGNGKLQFWVNESFSNPAATHVHIHIDADYGNDGDWVALGETTANLYDS